MQEDTMKTKFTVLSLILIMAVLFAGCSKKTIKPESILDTPDNHFRQGMRMFDRGDYKGAWDEFDRANKMNDKFPEAYGGKALIFAEKNEFKKAFKQLSKALDLDSKNRSVLIAKGRVLTARRKGNDWWEDALKAYDKALKYHPKDSEALYYKGVTLKEAYQFTQAVNAFAGVIENKDDWSKKANSEWELVQKIVRAAPGTRIGSKIALIDKIDRADIAVLFMEELRLIDLLKVKRKKNYDTSFKAPTDPMRFTQPQPGQAAGPTDIGSHWAKNWINEVVENGGMEMFPDHTFHPDELITRVEFAMMLQNLFILVSGEEDLATKFFGEESHFPDVSSSHPAYNAIVLCVQRGIMTADIDGSFGMQNNVSGADALLIIREFQNTLRMTF